MSTVYDNVKLEKMKLTVLQYLSDGLLKECIELNEPELHILSESFHDQLLVRLTCKVCAREEGEYTFEWYTSWWQELRNQILPNWWLSKYPSKMEVKEKIIAVATYPSLRVEDSIHEAHIDFLE